MKETADAFSGSGLAVVNWLREAAQAEMARRNGALVVVPALPCVDGLVGPMAISAIVSHFKGDEEFDQTVVFLDEVVAELRDRLG